MRRFSSTDLRRRRAEVFGAADEEPVIITVRGKPTYALISFQEFNRLTRLGRDLAAEDKPDKDSEGLKGALPDDKDDG